MDTLKIIGITESKDGVNNDIETYFRKVSTGYSPLEKPWNSTNNYPKASGYFRVMEQKHIKIAANGGGSQIIQKWVLDKNLQKKLEILNSEKRDSNNNRMPNVEPKKLPLMCLHTDVSQFAEAKMCKWNSANNLECTSFGDGTPYSLIQYDDDGGMSHVSTGQVDNDGNVIEKCDINNCVNRIKKGGKAVQCKPSIKLKLFPNIPGSDPNVLEAWRFDSSSINTVIRITSSLRRLKNLMELSYKAENKGVELTNEQRDSKEWFFGKNLCLVHTQIVSGGKKVWITDIIPSNTLKNELMGPILQAVYVANLAAKQRLIGIQESMSDYNKKPNLEIQEKSSGEILKSAESMLKHEQEEDDNIDSIIDAEITEIEMLDEEGLESEIDPSSGDTSNDSKSKKSAKDKLRNES